MYGVPIRTRLDARMYAQTPKVKRVLQTCQVPASKHSLHKYGATLMAHGYVQSTEDLCERNSV
jgi:hypothetical protein